MFPNSSFKRNSIKFSNKRPIYACIIQLILNKEQQHMTTIVETGKFQIKPPRDPVSWSPSIPEIM